MRDTIRTVAVVLLVAAVGALSALGVGALMGMSLDDLGHVVPLLAVSAVVTVAAALGARVALVRVSLR